MLTSTAIAFCMISQTTSAQIAGEQSAGEAGPSDLQSEVGDIIVTARHLEENLQTTPVAVTAISAEGLVRAQVVDIQDLQRTAPSLVVASGSAATSGYAFIAIRGQGNLTPIIANDPAIGTYIDGVYIPRPSQGLFDLQDLARAEILRGPQGTLFGRNTTGGAINIITKDPTGDFEGKVVGGVGSDEYRRFALTLNVPIANSLAGRINYNFRKRGSYGNNPLLRNDPWDLESHFVRAKLKFENDSFDLVLSGDYNKMKDHGQLVQIGAVNTGLSIFQPPSPLAGFVPSMTSSLHSRDAWWTTYASRLSVSPEMTATIATLPAREQAYYRQRTPYDSLEAYGLSATANIKLGTLNLKSISAYRFMDARGVLDTDGTPAPLLLTNALGDSESYSEEIQLSGDITEDLSFIAGGYYGREVGTETTRTQLFGDLFRLSTADAKNITKALFGQVYYQITPTIRAVGGFRYTWDSREAILHNRQIAGLPDNAVVPSSPTGVNCTVPAPDIAGCRQLLADAESEV